VQNADDSSYKNCIRQGVSPYLRFEITPDALFVETNEDGFLRANIEAICATGRSSKKASESDDYIGEKGFGFKSVFAIADEVQIQSGLWSFYFAHRQGDDGLGMVTPLDAPPAILPRGVTTRITLRYSSEAKQEYPKLLEAVRELPDTIILFLKRLRTFHVNTVGTDGQLKKSTVTKSYDTEPLRCTIALSRETDDTSTRDECTYLLFRTTKQDMPPHVRRVNCNEAKIELAFPVDPTSQLPKLSSLGQHIFAYLPLQRLPQLQVSIIRSIPTCANHDP
jgi:hypothetical protein